MLAACSEASGLCRENSQKIHWMQGGLNMLGSRRQRAASGSPKGVDISSWNPCHCHIPTLTSSLAPALHTPDGSGNSRGWRGKPANGQWAEPPTQVWPGWKGRGLWDRARQMPSAQRGPLKSLCCQAGQGVCSSPLPPLRTPPASHLGCLSWV
ncbi:unnamed protein product [Pipistrellus nathusii]|uniref:Uncharacterized protein n=1 Tax=Pipistrellus nathusii TaxID=59473 RepID=A0ABP0ABM6_PIPNA